MYSVKSVMAKTCQHFASTTHELAILLHLTTYWDIGITLKLVSLVLKLSICRQDGFGNAVLAAPRRQTRIV